MSLSYILNRLPRHTPNYTYDGRLKDTFGEDLPDLPNDPLIGDMGCSSGYVTEEIFEHYGGTVIGIDENVSSLSRAKNRTSSISGLLFEEGEAYDPSTHIGEEGADALFYMNMFMMVASDIEKEGMGLIADNIMQALKPGGYALISGNATYLVIRKGEEGPELHSHKVYESARHGVDKVLEAFSIPGEYDITPGVDPQYARMRALGR